LAHFLQGGNLDSFDKEQKNKKVMIVFLFQTPTGNEIEMQKLRDTQTNRDDGLKL